MIDNDDEYRRLIECFAWVGRDFRESWGIVEENVVGKYVKFSSGSIII